MSDRTVLFVSFYMYPSSSPGAKRIANFALRLPDYGWKPIILSASNRCFSHIDLQLSQDFTDHIDHYQIPCGSVANHIRILNTRYPRLGKYRLLAPLNGLMCAFPLAGFIQESLTWRRHALRAIEEINSRAHLDAIWVTIPPFPTMGLVPDIPKRLDCPVILDIRDPWTLPHERHERGRSWEWSSEFTNLAISLEKAVLSKVRYCVFNARIARDLYADFYNTYPSSFWRFIPNGFDPSLGSVNAHVFDRFTILHTGIISHTRSGNEVLESVSKLANRKLIQKGSFQFINVGSTARSFRCKVRRDGLSEYVRLIDFAPYRQCLEMQKGADWLLLLVGAEHAANVPSKLYEYLAVKRPILAVGPTGSEALEIIDRTNTGITANYDSIEQALSKIYLNDINVNPLSNADALDELRIDYLIRDVVSLLNACL